MCTINLKLDYWENLLSDREKNRENTGNLKIKFEWVPCTYHYDRIYKDEKDGNGRLKQSREHA